MEYSRSALRYAHSIGHTNVVYTQDGQHIVTCGSDGDIRKWSSVDADDPTSVCLGEFVTCIAQFGTRFIAATDLNILQSYTYADMEKDGTLLRFTAPITCLRTLDGCIAAGSEDCNVKVIYEDKSKPELDLEGHRGAVLGLDISLKKEIVITASGDGQLKIWNLSTGLETKSISGLPKVNSFETAECFVTPIFEPRHNQSLAYVKGKEIILLNTDTWEVQYVLSDENLKGTYTCCQFSYDGQYIAAGTTTGQINVYDFIRRNQIKCEIPSNDCQSITSIAWHPSLNTELAYCDSTGQLGTLFSSHNIDIMENPDLYDNDMQLNETEFIDDEAASTVQNRSGDENESEEDDENVVSIEKLKKKIMKGVNGEIEDDDSKHSMSESHISEKVVAIKTFKRQCAFQPGSTPTHLDNRYLVWNNVGIVSAHADNVDGSIDVEFHDASVHHSLHIPNYNSHNIGSLSSTALVLSSEGSTKIVCIALAASGNKEWSVQFPDCESVEALAATNKLIGVVTNLHFLRLFTVMGTQREIITIPGSVVAMAGYEDRFIICYHNASPDEFQQHLSAMLIQVTALSIRTQNLTLPLTPGRQLTWLGFSDCGSPAFADHMGLVQLYKIRSGCWFPICDTMKQSQSVSNNYFIIDISEKSQIIQAVLCRGSSYPMTNPRPMLQELKMQLPLCDGESEKCELEDVLIRSAIMSVDNKDKVIMETAIKLFALACRNETELRAKELIETIACPDVLLLAVKYATKLGRIHLSDRLYELMPKFENSNDTASANADTIEVLPIPSFTPTSYPQTVSSKLAPKAMEISSAKRNSTLKRFALNNSSSIFKKHSLLSSSILTNSGISSSNSEINVETEENTNENDLDLEHSDAFSKTNDQLVKEGNRSPLNSVNPFASKRKIADVDRNILMGSEKLKFAKK